jgi:hypothetical protein
MATPAMKKPPSGFSAEDKRRYQGVIMAFYEPQGRSIQHPFAYLPLADLAKAEREYWSISERLGRDARRKPYNLVVKRVNMKMCHFAKVEVRKC